MRLSTVILPLERWPASREKWRRAEELGFYAAYTYDHLSWLRLRDRPWFGAVPTLCAAALETTRLRLGTLVTSPNFRHPVPLAKDLLSLDDLSNGRLVVGVGSGGVGADARVLGQVEWSRRERTDRFVEFVGLLDELLMNVDTSMQGLYYSALEARMLPGTIQRPRPPFLIAADGGRGMRLAVQYGEGWVTLGRSSDGEQPCGEVVAEQTGRLNDILDEHEDSRLVGRVLLDGFSDENPLVSVDAFVDWAGRYEALGITELVVHWPEPDSLFAVDATIFERIALEGLAQL